MCTVLTLFFSFSITNLKYWGGSEQIISKTLQLLSELSVGYGTVRKLVKLEEVGFLLSQHTAEHYPFLGVNVPITEMRCRSMFYTSLGRLLMVELGEDEEKFEAFMIPHTQSFESLGQVLMNSSNSFNTEEVKIVVASVDVLVFNSKLALLGSQDSDWIGS